MSSLKIEPLLAETAESGGSKPKKEQLAETGGLVFSDGSCLELIKNDAGQLSLLHSFRKRGAQRIKYQRRTYVPPIIHESLSEALTLPHGRVSSSITDLFIKLCTLFIEPGFSAETGKKLAYWTLSTWFVELLPQAPCLLITGSRPEATLVLQLLNCVVRHGLSLTDISMSGLRYLPMHLRPTLLINHLSPSMLKALSASSYPRAYVPTREGVADLYCGKAVYAGTYLVNDALDGAFHVHLASFNGKLPVINDLALRQLAADFQPLLLDYRMRCAAKVRDADFEVPGLRSELRILGRVLGSAIVDAPELQGNLVTILQDYQEEIRVEDLLEEQCIVVEALLSHSHCEPSDHLVYVGQLADTSNGILKDRGSREKLEPKALGCILRKLGFTPKRNAKGFAIRINEDGRHRIHQLAREFQVSATNEGEGCSHCRDILDPELKTESPDTSAA